MAYVIGSADGVVLNGESMCIASTSSRGEDSISCDLGKAALPRGDIGGPSADMSEICEILWACWGRIGRVGLRFSGPEMDPSCEAPFRCHLTDQGVFVDCARLDDITEISAERPRGDGPVSEVGSLCVGVDGWPLMAARKLANEGFFTGNEKLCNASEERPGD